MGLLFVEWLVGCVVRVTRGLNSASAIGLLNAVADWRRALGPAFCFPSSWEGFHPSSILVNQGLFLIPIPFGEVGRRECNNIDVYPDSH